MMMSHIGHVAAILEHSTDYARLVYVVRVEVGQKYGTNYNETKTTQQINSNRVN